MDGINIYHELSAIPNRKYIGYIWMSDKEEPIVLKEPTVYDFSNIEINPFIQEALLYNEEENISVMVRHTGDYNISEFCLNKLPEKHELVEKQYYPHRLGFNDKRVCISQLWLPQKDENCEEMEVLTLKAHIFTGFKEPKKTKEPCQ